MRITGRILSLGGSAFVAALFVSGCMSGPALGLVEAPIEGLPPYGRIGVDEAVSVILALQDDPRFVLLDIRTPEEVESGHLPGAVSLDFGSPTFSSELAMLDTERIYLIYCRTANRSGQAYDMMAALGFARVYDMQGGIRQWGELGYPICEGPLGAEHVCIGTYPDPSASG